MIYDPEKRILWIQIHHTVVAHINAGNPLVGRRQQEGRFKAQFQRSWFEQAWLLPTLYFLLSVAHQGVRVGRKTYVVDIAEGNERTDYVAVSNTAIGFILLFTGVIGALGAMFSVPLIVLVLSLLGIVGAIMGYRLPEA